MQGRLGKDIGASSHVDDSMCYVSCAIAYCKCDANEQILCKRECDTASMASAKADVASALLSCEQEWQKQCIKCK